MIRNQMYFGISFEMIYNFLVLGELLIKIAITKYITLEIHNEILFERSNESDVNCITINVPVDEKRYTINSDKIAMYICAKFSFK